MGCPSEMTKGGIEQSPMPDKAHTQTTREKQGEHSTLLKGSD